MTEGSLPARGRIPCSICHGGQPYAFDRTVTEEDGWRITDNPMAWGSREPVVAVLGFSKGPSQAGALARLPLDEVPFRGGRTELGKILHHVGLLGAPDAKSVEAIIRDPTGLFHFGSLVRCTVERRDPKTLEWKGTGGGMLDRFVARPFGAQVTATCARTFLGDLPVTVRVVVMLGLGTNLGYVRACRRIWTQVRPGEWRDVNEVSYKDGRITVVHTEHFKSQGNLLPRWLSGTGHERGRFGLMARSAVASALGVT